MYITNIFYNLNSLTVFTGLRRTPLLQNLEQLLKEAVLQNPCAANLSLRWAKFATCIVAYNGTNFFDIVYKLALHNKNIWTLALEKLRLGAKVPANLQSLAELDLQKLNTIASLDIEKLAGGVADILEKESLSGIAKTILQEAKALCSLSVAAEHKSNFCAAHFKEHITQNGAGIFSVGAMFYWSPSKHKIKAAANPDAVKIKDLCAYENERNVVVTNTKNFLSGKGANNILLYGDRGTGKSATVKALANEFAPLGLRLIEVRKNEIKYLPKIMELLKDRALYFILFIDDLSFESEGAEFNMLKAILEGGIEAKPKNIAIYATSNRRHLVKEKTSDRPASQSDVRAFDTIQEQLSLSDRFGVTVIFTAPAQDEYLKIARFLAEKSGLLSQSPEALAEFEANAVRWERWFNGRSPRTACQFIEWALGGKSFPWQ
ncbi:MAG: ATP-binding protein [Spirochaetaceae bacterium]|jgi:predicted AAA+ superfamily ATPase|nr:ATP-binding protein [Spirochaetaceae bacterium]